MTPWSKTAAIGLLVLGLAACATEHAEAPAEAPAAEDPVAEAPVDEESIAEEAPTADSNAESDCLAAVAEQVGVAISDLSVISAEMGETSTTVLVEVPDAQAPWQCNWGFTSDGPGVLEVFYADEG